MFPKNYRAYLASALVCVFGNVIHAQVSYGTVGLIYSQNFDTATVLADGSTPWVNNSTYAGWYVTYYNGSTTLYNTPTTATVTTSTGTGFNFYRSADSTDVALGSQSTDGTLMTGVNTGGVFFGLQIQNTTDSSLTSFTLGYTGEEWRRAANSTLQGMTFAYSLNATSLSDTAATWIQVSEAGFTGPKAGASTAVLDGNLAENRVVVSDVVVNGIVISSGSVIWLRWFDTNHAAVDHGLAIDDVTFSATSNPSAVPEPSTYAMIAGAALMAFACWKRPSKATRL